MSLPQSLDDLLGNPRILQLDGLESRRWGAGCAGVGGGRLRLVDWDSLDGCELLAKPVDFPLEILACLSLGGENAVEGLDLASQPLEGISGFSGILGLAPMGVRDLGALQSGPREADDEPRTRCNYDQPLQSTHRPLQD